MGSDFLGERCCSLKLSKMNFIGKNYKVTDNSYALDLTRSKAFVDLAPCEMNEFRECPLLTIKSDPFKSKISFLGVSYIRSFVIVSDNQDNSYIVMFDEKNIR